MDWISFGTFSEKGYRGEFEEWEQFITLDHSNILTVHVLKD